MKKPGKAALFLAARISENKGKIKTGRFTKGERPVLL